ncbi:MAG: polyprenyl synthetase family protein [Eubacterium sp.]|nr:polyprenyl synthetase family protein [Eubacterium sp.]
MGTTIGDQLDRKVQEIEEILKEALPEESGYAKTILEAMNYSIMAGGKRLRPLLMREMFYLFSGGDETVLRHFMVAIEMIHTYSLVHDDLPALDDDDMRRGRESTHKKFGEAMGILAGDALLNAAYEQISTALSAVAKREIVGAIKKNDQMWRAVMAFRKLASCAGVSGMIGGQVVDVENTGKDIDAEMLLYIYRGKTSALIAAAMMVGAILGGADEYSLQMIERIGCDIGMAFQIRDDILDVTGDSEEMGKPVHSDEGQNKFTYAAIHGIEDSEKAVEEYTDQALKRLEALPVATSRVETKEFLKGLFLMMAKRNQ